MEHAAPDWKKVLAPVLAGEAPTRLPVAIIDLDAFDRNARRMAEALPSGKPIRIATKSLRVPALIRRALGLGAPWTGLMCFAAEEARYLASEGFDDFLIAYPTLQAPDLAALHDLHARGKRVTLVVDSAEGAAALARELKGARVPFPVVIDVDMSWRLLGGLLHLGVRRSPIRSEAHVGELLDAIARHPELRAVGMMAYEAQVAGLGDRNPFKPLLNPIAGWVRRSSARAVARRREALATPFVERKLPITLYNGGGTGSLSFCASETHLTEATAGSGFYCPHLFDYYSNLELEPAAYFALQVVRASDAGYVTAQGGGYIASGESGPDRAPRPWWPAGLSLIGTEGCGEVQTPLRVPESVSLRPGDFVIFRHAKAGELMERFNEVLLISGGQVAGREKTYRGLGLSFF